MFKIIENKKDQKICCAYRCGSKRKQKDRFCSKHRARFRKENDFLGYTYDLLKSNANRRNKVFTLTKVEFKEFCDETGYLELKGKAAGSASIDRIDPSEGYEKGNIQMISLSQNSAKMHKDRNNSDCPF